ncbi:ribonuclease D [Acinetobacter qingfengensis]|uniref:Ribonuclease D n=1 Tax=Acinetobacter qingfengensis TaxID=1262585 RepID=A0A1E7REU1_9GAMM|nr:HRDC domain-containing protein [Acinetobacter qingfengensis]KAA8735676.1 ribonuclease D [Acinetobacter qingfengensis]OEY97878.1 ribonuclease D [Acinetobacter qingfengensis]
MYYQWVDQQTQLSHLVEQINCSALNALDTEFIKVDTLYPKLGVLQININDQVYLIDGHLDLADLWQKLFQARLNIFHACGEDIDLIYHYAQHAPLNNVLDTQIALAFLGYGMQMGYQAALAEILNVDVEKDQTRSDWLARPLSEEQIRYAVSDVYYLPQLAENVIQRLKQQGIYHFVVEDCQHYCQSLAEKLPLDQLYLDAANYRHSSRQLMQLQQLAMWREQLAIDTNQPRSFILKNNTIHRMLERTPHTMQQLFELGEVKPAILREHGKHILKLLNELPDQKQWPKRLAKPYRYYLDETTHKIQQLLTVISQQYGIPTDVLLRKKWLQQLQSFVLNERQDLSTLNIYLTGWRLNLLTLPLIEILAQDIAARRSNISC